MERPVALLDGDGGGLRLLAELTRQVPAEDYVYLADSARGPYGRAAAADVRRWTEEGAYFLLRFDPKVLVLADHTMGALAGESLRVKFPVPVFSPGALLCREAAERGFRVVAVLGSETSLASGFYQEALAKAGVRGVLCPASALTEAVADGCCQAPEGPLASGARPAPFTGTRADPEGPAGRLGMLLGEALAPALESEPRVEAVLLAESALGLLTPLVEELMGPGVTVIDVTARLAGEVERLLALTRTLRPPGGEGARHFLASGDVNCFGERAAALYGGPLGRVGRASPQRFFAPRVQ
jgi:glutamate racemase